MGLGNRNLVKTFRAYRIKRTILFGFIIADLFCFNSYSKPSLVPKPNIILFSIDTLRADHLGCYGYEKNTSPYIDGFAKNAVFFENAISQSAHTAPSHMSLFTALMPDVHQIGNFDNLGGENKLSPKITTLAQILKDQGYLTAAVHGGGNVGKRQGFNRGFDLYLKTFRENSATPEKLPDEIQQAIAKSKKEEKPLFLFLHHYFCHSPYVYAPKAYRLHFLDKKVKGLPVGLEDLQKGGDLHTSFWQNVNLRNPEHRRHIVSLYDGEVYFSDYLFNKVIKLLKENGYYDNSFVILISDHGEEFNEHGGRGHGRLFIEHLHVPLIVKFPSGKYGGTSIKELVRLVDIMPTLFELLDIPIDFKIQGVSFLPLIIKQGNYNPLIVSHSVNSRDGIRFYKDGYVYSKEMNKANKQFWERLYDFQKDPKEQHNLSNEKPPVMAKMREIAKDLLKDKNRFADLMPQKGGNSPEKPDKKLLKQLKALGYVQ